MKLEQILAIIPLLLLIGCTNIATSPGAVPFHGWLFSVDTPEGTTLFFVRTHVYSGDDVVYTEDQVKEITMLSDIHPITEMQLTAEQARDIAAVEIEMHASLDVAERYDLCMAGCQANQQGPCPAGAPSNCDKWCGYWSTLIPKTVGQCEEECTVSPEAQPQPAEPGQAVPQMAPSQLYYGECVDGCVATSQHNSEVQQCLSSLSPGVPDFFSYSGDRRPSEWYVPVFRDGKYYGYVGVDDRCKWVAKQSNGCRQGEVTPAAYALPSDEGSRAILGQYLNENGIGGTITESFYMKYMVENFDAMQ